MNRLERIQAAVNFRALDRVPVIPQVFGHAAVLAGVPLGDYLRDGELLARCQLQALEHYGYDAVFAVLDVGVETEAIGSLLSYRADQYPSVQSHALTEGTDLSHLRIPDPRQAGRMPELLKAARRLRREVGDEVLVVGCVVGPMTLVTQLLGIEKALYLAIDDSGGICPSAGFCRRGGRAFRGGADRGGGASAPRLRSVRFAGCHPGWVLPRIGASPPYPGLERL